MGKLEYINEEMETVFRDGRKSHKSLCKVIDSLESRYSDDAYLKEKLDHIKSEAKKTLISLEKVYLEHFSLTDLKLPDEFEKKLSSNPRLTYIGTIFDVVNKLPGNYLEEGFDMNEVKLLEKELKKYGLKLRERPFIEESPFIKKKKGI